MKPFLRERIWWARIPQDGRTAIPRSLQTTDKKVATDICRFLGWLIGRRESEMLRHLVDGTSPIGPAYDAWRTNRFTEYVRSISTVDTDLEPLIPEWGREMERVGSPQEGSRTKYIAQVRTFIPKGVPFPMSGLTKPAIREWLSTKGKSSNRYRAALSSFCTYLVDVEVLPFNPVLTVKAAKPSVPRGRYLDQEDSKRLLDALSGPARAYHALSAATALERQGLLRLTRRDVDLTKKLVYARATKTKSRSRTVGTYDRWSWAWDIFATWLKANPMFPDALVFTDKADWYYRQLVEACEALGIEDYRSHDWRHTYAVQAFKDGKNVQEVSHQLGHANPTITLNVYGRYIPQNHTMDHTVANEPPPMEQAK